MITSQVLYHLTKGATFNTTKPNILTYFTSFRLGLPLEIGVFIVESVSVGGGSIFSTGNDIPCPFSLA